MFDPARLIICGQISGLHVRRAATLGQVYEGGLGKDR